MAKSTNEGWPDPTEWAARLFDDLESVGEEYFALKWEKPADPEAFAGANLKQAKAAEAVLTVLGALHELPRFKHSKGTAILHDLAGALRDLVMGGSPRMLTPTRGGTRGGDGIHRNYVKVFAVWAVRHLVEAHSWLEGRAVAHVAKVFADAGATGRKGKPLSRSTLQDWCNKASPHSSNPDEIRIDREVEKHMADSRADPLWPGTEEDALAWVARIARAPLIASKYG